MLHRHSTAIVTAILLLIGVQGLVDPIVEIRDPITRNYNEGWNAVHARQVLDGEKLYDSTDETARVFTNYPPLSFLILAAVSGADGDAIVRGRVLSLLGLLVVVGCLGWITYRLTAQRQGGLLAAAMALAFLTQFFGNYVATNDPQMIGHALQVAGLAIFVTSGRRRHFLLLALAGLLLGGLVKHNLLVVPLGVTLWIFRHQRRDFALWTLTAIGATAAITAAMVGVWGPDLLAGILSHERVFAPHYVALAAARWMTPLATLALIGWSTIGRQDDPRASLFTTISVLAALLGLLVSGGEGVSYNGMFDLVFASSVAAVLSLRMWSRWLADVGGSMLPSTLLLIAVIAPALLVFPLNILRSAEEFETRPERVATARADLAFLSAHEGRILTEDAALSYWTGRTYELDFFNYGQRLRTHHTEGRSLIEDIEAKEFAVIQLERADATTRLDATVDDAIQRSYRLARESPVYGFFFVPRESE